MELVAYEIHVNQFTATSWSVIIAQGGEVVYRMKVNDTTSPVDAIEQAFTEYAKLLKG